MDETIIIISLLPCIFMIHEFEEIIGMKAWLKRNEAWLSKRIPRFSRKIQSLSQVSVPAFALAVLEEFLIVSTVTFTALAFQWYYAWIAVFTAFSFHIAVHIVQWVIVQKYIPVVITSFLSVPYILWGMKFVLSSFPIMDIAVCFICGLLITAANLLLIHKLAVRFDEWLKGTTR